MLEERERNRARRDTDLEAGQVGSVVDRLGAAGDLTEAFVPDLGHGLQADLLDVRADLITDGAVQRAPGRVGILEGEADIVDGG